MRALVLLCAIFSAFLFHPPAAGAWTLWINQENSRSYANRVTEVSRTWERRGASLSFDECSAGKRQLWQEAVAELADRSRYPDVESVDSIADEAIFVALRKGGESVGGHRNRHFHCLPDEANPRG